MPTPSEMPASSEARLSDHAPVVAESPPPSPFDLYKLHLAGAERVSDRRAAANSWMLSVNAAITGLTGYLSTYAGTGSGLWLFPLPAAGIIVCIAWIVLLTSYRRLNAAKFEVLLELERDMSVDLLRREREIYRKLGRRPFASVETTIPFAFGALHAGVLLAALLSA
jgi:hypothetical protein